MTIATVLIAPAGIASTNVTGISGTTYAVDANGFVTITTQGDVLAFLNAGYRQAATPLSSQAIGANGLVSTPLKLLDAGAPTGGPLAAAPSAGVLGYSVTLGTSFSLVTEAANGNTKADSALFEYILPPGYVAGQNVTVTINAGYTLGSGVLTTKTVGLAAYRTAKDGTQAASICATAAQTFTAAGATDYAFTLTGATLSPGDRLILQPTITLTETSAHNVTGNINSVRVS